MTPKKRFVIPGTMLRAQARKRENVSFFIKADDREDARWQVHHGVIVAEMQKTFPGAAYHYDLRRMRLHYDPCPHK